MSNKDKNIITIAFVLFAVATLTQELGLSANVSFKVIVAHAVFMIWGASVRYIADTLEIRWVHFLPASLAIYYVCWIPAFDFWGNRSLGGMAFKALDNYAWYATAWIQLLIMFAIMVAGHFMIYYFDNDRRGR